MEIELFKASSDGKKNVVIRRTFDCKERSKWTMENPAQHGDNGKRQWKQIKEKVVHTLTKSLNIQINNLCVFLAQERVQSFHRAAHPKAQERVQSFHCAAHPKAQERMQLFHCHKRFRSNFSNIEVAGKHPLAFSQITGPSKVLSTSHPQHSQCTHECTGVVL